MTLTARGLHLPDTDEAAANTPDLGIHYEASFVRQLGQVDLLYIARGDMDTASSTLSAATALEKDAPDIILPSSTSVFFMPSSAWEGVLRLAFFKRNDSETAAAASAFAQCLTYAGHPNMPFCLIGRARTAESAATYYLELLKQWGAMRTAQCLRRDVSAMRSRRGKGCCRMEERAV